MVSKIILSVRSVGLGTTFLHGWNFIDNRLQIGRLLNPVSRSWNNVRNRFDFRHIIHLRRKQISKDLNEKFKGTVQYGFFKGFVLGDGYQWGQADLGNMLLGIYEKEVIDALAAASSTRDTLIDFGAADGYFAIGCLVNNMFEKTYCYELSEVSRLNLKNNAEINGISNRIDISGIASPNFYNELTDKGLNFEKCVILCDIEGGEFDLFTDESLKAIKQSIVIIEIHDWHENGQERFKQLKERAGKYFIVNELKTGSRDLSEFPEIADLRDDDRWLICSEGRHQLMTWLYLSPKLN
jgi:hypothetical protein